MHVTDLIGMKEDPKGKLQKTRNQWRPADVQTPISVRGLVCHLRVRRTQTTSLVYIL